MKKILVVYFTQSGQLREILERITHPLQTIAEITYCEIKMQQPYPFPWTEESFFDVFPETFLQIPSEIIPISENILQTNYDLILLGYQTWYLSPSLPITSFLKSKYAKVLLQGKPVITINASRNMWIMAQEKIKEMLSQYQTNLVGNIALVDRHLNHVSVITIVRWMMTGSKKQRGLFPDAGVSDEDIQDSEKFGHTIAQAVTCGNYTNLQSKLVAQNAVVIKPFLVSTDKKGNRIFRFWATFIYKRKTNRKQWLKIFYIYLWIAIWIIAPIVYIFYLVLYPFNVNKIIKQKRYYQSV